MVLSKTEKFILLAKEKHGNKYDYSLVRYIDNNTKVPIICKKDGIFMQKPRSHSNEGKGCPICAIFTKEEIIQILNDKNIELLDNYIPGIDTVHSNKKCRCKICNYGNKVKWSPEINNLFHGGNCPSCIGNAKLTQDTIIERLNTKSIQLLDNYIVGVDTNKSKKKCICQICKYEWKPSINQVSNLKRGTGCPNCNLYKNQKLMYKILQKFDNSFRVEYCLTEINEKARLLRFDAYSPKYNIAIEYDGDGHFRPVRFNGMPIKQAENNFLITKERDIYKNNFCQENNIKLIRIDGRKYKDKKLVNYVNEIISGIK